MEWDSTLLNEDDSLLQATPTRIGNHISPMKYSRIPEDSVKDNCSSSKDTSNKENISVHNSEGQKLNVEPVQMKKKKKGGGYNLRKSLAWDRAFFTEEGVLNPLELSMISGTHVNSSRERSSTINENDSLSHDYKSNIESADLQALERNLFKEVPSVSLKKEKGSVHLPPKHNSPAHAQRVSSSLASPKVLPTRGASRAGSGGGGCSRPLPLSSLKRPANVNASQAVTKESKHPRIPISKPGHFSTPVAKRSTTQVIIMQNQRNVAPKSSTENVKHNQNKPKAGSGSLPVKASVSRSKRNVVNAPIYPHSSTQLTPPVGNKVANTGPKVILDDVGPSVVVPLSECQDGPTKLPASLPHVTSTTSSIKQHKQFPAMKPSGLRMPSPSLGFFGQPKSSVSHCASRRIGEADIPGLRKPGFLRPPHPPVRVLEVVHDIVQTVDTVILRSGSEFQAPSHERMKENFVEHAMEKGSKFSNEDESSKPMNDRSEICSKLGSSILVCHESRISTGSETFENSLSLPRASKEHGNILESSSGEDIRASCGDEHNKDIQNRSRNNLENTDLKTQACMEIELRSSGSSSKERCATLEKPLAEDDATLQSHIEETELQMTNTISTSRCKNNLNHCSEVGHSNDFSSKSIELQHPCLMQYPQNNDGLSAADSVFLEKDSEECIQEIIETRPGTMLDVPCSSELDNPDEVSQVLVEMKNECFDISKMVGEALAKDSMQSLAEVASSMEKHNCSVTRNNVICSGKITSSDSHSALNEVSKSLITGERRTFNRNDVQNWRVNEDYLMVEEPENLTLYGACLVSEIADVNCGSVLAENKFHGKDKNCDLQNIIEADSTVNDSSMIPMEKSKISQVSNAGQTDECEKEVTNSSNLLQVEDEPVDCCISQMQEMSNLFTAVVPTEKFGEVGFPNFCILVEEVPQSNQNLLPEICLSRERTALAARKENNVFERGLPPLSSKSIDASGGESESSRAVRSTPPKMHVNGDDGDKYNGPLYVMHTTPGCVEVEPSSEIYRRFTGNHIKHDVEHGGLLVEDPPSSRKRNEETNRLKKSTLLDETRANVPQDIDSLAEESDCDLDAASCLANDADTTAPIRKSQSSSSRNSVTIIPPTNAVPFSDEWLAAMEAAGEDILKMKSGAVQNSPTEKSLPEPSPWSPVRRKTNPIGPFDCTKFTNNLPSDSQ